MTTRTTCTSLLALGALLAPAAASAFTADPVNQWLVDGSTHIDQASGVDVDAGTLIPGQLYAFAISAGPGIGHAAGATQTLSIVGRELVSGTATTTFFSLNGLGSGADDHSYHTFTAGAGLGYRLFYPSDSVSADNIGDLVVTLYRIDP